MINFDRADFLAFTFQQTEYLRFEDALSDANAACKRLEVAVPEPGNPFSSYATWHKGLWPPEPQFCTEDASGIKQSAVLFEYVRDYSDAEFKTPRNCCTVL